MFLSPVILFALIFVNSAVCNDKVPCDLKNSKCLTESSRVIFKDFVCGLMGAPTSDPLFKNVIEGKLPLLEYKYTNATLSGIKHCRVELVKLNPDDLKYESLLICPCLTLESECEVKGEVRSKLVDGKGICKADLYDFYINFNGDYEKKIEENGQVHMCLKNTEINVDCKGNVEHGYRSLDNCDTKDANAVFTKEDWHAVEKISRQYIFTEYFTQYVKHINILLDLQPFNKLFTQ